MTDVQHTDVGAYALGLLTEAEATRFEEHLAGCDRCADELESLLGVAEVLSDLGPGAPEAEPPPPGLLERALAEVAARRRTVRRRRLYVVGAAAALIIGGPVATAAVLSDRDDPPPVAATGSSTQEFFEKGDLRKVGATDPDTRVTATVATEAKAWGTHAVLELKNVTGPRKCSLVAVGKDGSEETLSTWSVPSDGYGDGGAGGGGPKTATPALYIDGGAAMTPEQIARFVVRTWDGEQLVSVATGDR
ncbi:zf-HC2 domain-containing protein [Streptomyces sp. NPDC051940]|uniref:zf-HC2 domain-containing protein n=1 Tax=Streptomyces sp. NPDC051940 TaxID=3155675 RepID=UPI0034187B04